MPTDLSESAQSAIDELVKMLSAPETGFRLEAARELLKFEAVRLNFDR